MTEKAKETNQQEEISDVSLTRSPGRFVGVFRLLSRLRRSSFHGCGLRDGRTWREGVLSLKHRRCNETKEYHRAQQSPHEHDWLPGNQNVHGRPPGTKSGSRLPLLYCEKTRRPFSSLSFFFLVVLASSGMRESKFQIGREIHVFCRDVNRYVQTSFAAEISA